MMRLLFSPALNLPDTEHSDVYDGEAKDVLVGTLTCDFANRKKRDYGYIKTLYIQPEYRFYGLNASSLVLSAVEDELCRRSFPGVFALVLDRKTGNFFERHGYKGSLKADFGYSRFSKLLTRELT